MTTPDPHPALRKGDHLRVWLGLYWHHGIFLGEGQVAEYANWFHGGRIREIPLPEFHRGRPFEIVTHPGDIDPDEIVARARDRVGEPGYDLLFNNCEHFATWCATGHHKSPQVDRVARAAAVGVAVGTTAILLARSGLKGRVAEQIRQRIRRPGA